ncbi:MAG: TIM44-related membrane protein TimA [Caulobacteraceae bacterium]|nr:TIM44-related membrane protein TimA [Caulobacteraceae bacterium]
MQLLELLILAVLAAVVLYQLYAVLGRRVGRQPEEGLPAPTPRRPDETDARPREAEDVAPATGMAGLQARDPSFDPVRFVEGARSAYEAIVRAFAAGDRAALARLVSPTVMTGFDKAIGAREAEGRTETVEFIHPPRADLDSAEASGDVARARVRFLAEFRSRTKGPEGEGVDDRRTAELWTFERRLSSRDPNWTLVRVDEANA